MGLFRAACSLHWQGTTFPPFSVSALPNGFISVSSFHISCLVLQWVVPVEEASSASREATRSFLASAFSVVVSEPELCRAFTMLPGREKREMTSQHNLYASAFVFRCDSLGESDVAWKRSLRGKKKICDSAGSYFPLAMGVTLFLTTSYWVGILCNGCQVGPCLTWWFLGFAGHAKCIPVSCSDEPKVQSVLPVVASWLLSLLSASGHKRVYAN